MPVPRLLITDVDRTLLTHDYVLPERVEHASAAARAAGMRLVLATARSPEGVRPYAEQLGAGAIAICFNGGWIGDTSTRLAWREKRIARCDALEVMEAAAQAGLRPMWFSGSAVHALADDPVIMREAAVTREPVEFAECLDALPGEPGKIMCVAATTADRQGSEALRRHFGERLAISASHPRLLEIGPQGVSKRAAAALVAAHLGIDRSESAAAGDAENDLGMLAWAGTAVTVANAVPEAKRLASFVAPSCDAGGLADAVAWLMQDKRALTPAF
jgi:Cof subfamily protein (haloacid dehalogenase superfamily)